MVDADSKFHKDGRLFVADGKHGILEISSDGTMRVAASQWEGQRFLGINDLVFATSGDT